MSTGKIFISYSRKDQKFVEKLVDSLRKEGLTVWFDEHLRSGEDWDDALEEQIKGSSHMIIVLSKTSVASDNVKNEMRFAMDHDKQIQPIYIEECSVPLSMRRMHYIDFKNLGFDEGLSRLVQDIKTEKGESDASTIQNDYEKKSPKSKSKVFVGLLALILIVFAVWKFWPESSEKEENIEKVVNDLNWQKIDGSTDLYEYSSYISTYFDSEKRLSSAISSAQNLLKDEAAIIVDSDELFDLFHYLVYQNSEGYQKVDYRLVDFYKGWPKKGDLLIAQKQILVMDEKTMDVMPGVFLNPGDIIQFSEGIEEKQALLKFYFIKKEVEQNKVPTVQELRNQLLKISQNMFFETGRPKLNTDRNNPNGLKTIEALGDLTDLLKSLPDYDLLIEGHTDSVGSDKTNKMLSQLRADAIAAYLSNEKSIKNLITPIGYGEERPIGDNKTSAGRAMNRRVQLIMIPPVTY